MPGPTIAVFRRVDPPGSPTTPDSMGRRLNSESSSITYSSRTTTGAALHVFGPPHVYSLPCTFLALPGLPSESSPNKLKLWDGEKHLRTSNDCR